MIVPGQQVWARSEDSRHGHGVSDRCCTWNDTSWRECVVLFVYTDPYDTGEPWAMIEPKSDARGHWYGPVSKIRTVDSWAASTLLA